MARTVSRNPQSENCALLFPPGNPRPPGCLHPGTALLHLLEVLLHPWAPESPGIPPRCVGGGLSLGPGRPHTSAAAPRPRRPRSRSQTRAVWTLRGPRSAAPPAGGSGPPRSVTRGPLLGAGVRVRRAAPRPSGKKSRAPLRAPGLPVRSAPPDRPPTARSLGRPRARYCGRPAPRAQRPGLRGSGGERRAAAPRRGPALTPRLGCSCCGSPSPALARSPGTWLRSFGAAGTRSCVRLGVGARRRESEDADGRHTALLPAARGRRAFPVDAFGR
ncbi:translation initiation factor IF-2-like [Microtus oregoni]|uniref:translation initiation factor IF-2-like n=1 Tax=Microtus oregoni TaxID=111838 RepID=UPI001BB2A843|nr:translation initiation factor IF-2-like [Microtus oregoni]